MVVAHETTENNDRLNASVSLSSLPNYLSIFLLSATLISALLGSNWAEAASISIVTDYPAYVKGDAVEISGTYSPNQDSLLYVSITNPSGVERLWQVNGNTDGTFQTTYPLDENAWLQPGTYKVSVQHGGIEEASTTFVFITNDSVKIPSEMRYVTKQWVLGSITESDFIKNVQYYVNIGLLKIPPTTGSNQINQPIPQWVQADARSWLQGASDATLAKSLYYFYYEGFLPTQLGTGFQPIQQESSIPQQSVSSASNTNVLLYTFNGIKEFTAGQTVQLRGQVIERTAQGSVGVPNVSFSIVDSDSGKVLGVGSTDSFGTFSYDWTATQDNGKSVRDLIGVFQGNGQLQPSQSNVLPLRIYSSYSTSSSSDQIIQNPSRTSTNSHGVLVPTLPSSPIPGVLNLGSVRIIGGTGNFAQISSGNKVIALAPGSTLSGTVELSTINNLPTSENVPFIMIPSWGSHDSGWQTIQNNISVGSSKYVMNVNLRIPSSPGTYYLVFAFANEVSGQYIAALSDSSLGQPNWNSGKTLADLSSTQVFEAQQDGHIQLQKLMATGYSTIDLPVDVIIVKSDPSVIPIQNPLQSSPIPTAQNQSSQFDASSVIGVLVMILILALIVYAIYRRISRRRQFQHIIQNPRGTTTPQPTTYLPPPAYPSVSHISRPLGGGSRGSSKVKTNPPPSQISPTTSMSTSAWPLNSDYRLAFKNLSKFAKNLELKRSTPVYRNGEPIFGTGNFGGVYRIRSGINEYAVKYFTKFSDDREERYSKISDYLKKNLHNGSSEFLIHFEYMPDSIIVGTKGSTYPLLKMDWVDGSTLHDYIEKNYKNKKLLIEAAESFICCLETLQDNQIAHGDLSDGNVMIKNSSQIQIKLIDYDCMFIPPFAGQRSPENGHANFQHPMRHGGKYYNEKLDNFATLVIYLTLYGIAEDPTLRKYNDEGIFIKSDFEQPNNSPVIKQLLNSKSGKVRRLTNLLLDSLKHDPLWGGIDPVKIKSIPHI